MTDPHSKIGLRQQFGPICSIIVLSTNCHEKFHGRLRLYALPSYGLRILLSQKMIIAHVALLQIAPMPICLWQVQLSRKHVVVEHRNE